MYERPGHEDSGRIGAHRIRDILASQRRALAAEMVRREGDLHRKIEEIRSRKW